MVKNRKVIIYVIVAIIVVCVIAGITIFILSTNNKNTSSSVIPTTNTPIATLRAEAEQARKSNQKAKAILLLEEAQQKIEALPKSDQKTNDENTNAKIDVEAQLYLLQHQTTGP